MGSACTVKQAVKWCGDRQEWPTLHCWEQFAHTDVIGSVVEKSHIVTEEQNKLFPALIVWKQLQ